MARAFTATLRARLCWKDDGRMISSFKSFDH